VTLFGFFFLRFGLNGDLKPIVFQLLTAGAMMKKTPTDHKRI
jgi:hypothetical protein